MEEKVHVHWTFPWYIYSSCQPCFLYSCLCFLVKFYSLSVLLPCFGQIKELFLLAIFRNLPNFQRGLSLLLLCCFDSHPSAFFQDSCHPLKPYPPGLGPLRAEPKAPLILSGLPPATCTLIGTLVCHILLALHPCWTGHSAVRWLHSKLWPVSI